MADQSDFGATIDTTDHDNDDNTFDDSDAGSSISKTRSPNFTDDTQSDADHSNIPSDYMHKSRTQHIEEKQSNDPSSSSSKRPRRSHSRRKSSKIGSQYLSAINQGSSPSPNSFHSASSSQSNVSASSSYRSIQKKDSNNISMLKILDAKPLTLSNASSGSEDPRCAKLMQTIFDKIYFSGNWNRGSYVSENENDLYKDQRRQMYRPFAVFGDDELFIKSEDERRQNREQQCFYSKMNFDYTSYPLPSQRLKRYVFPFKKYLSFPKEDKRHIEQSQADNVQKAELEYYDRIKNRATLLRKLYDDITTFQTNDVLDEDIHSQKRSFWHKQQFELNEQNVGVVSEHNVPPWITKGWYGKSALANNRNLRMPGHKIKGFKSFYPKTARWDRILRGCYEMDWKDEEIFTKIIEHDENECPKDFDILLKVLRREKLFETEHKKWTEFRPTARDPFVHIYEFYGVDHLLTTKQDNVYKRMRDLYWTLQNLWYLGSRFDVDGCLRVPALINPIEWQYTIALKLIWDGIKFLMCVNKLHPCSEKHCGIKDANYKTIQFLKKICYAFDFNEAQLYDWRYLGYLLRHTLYDKLYHCLSKHAGKYQIKAFTKQKKETKYGIEMAHHDEYRFVLDYLKYLVICNNMFEFFSPSQIGRLWQYASGTFEELRMIYPEISLNVIENEYVDLIETQRHTSTTKRMTAGSYKYYFGEFFHKSQEKNMWQDARGVIKAYNIKNTLFPIPDMFEQVFAGHNAIYECNPTLVRPTKITSVENYQYKRSKLEKYIGDVVHNVLQSPVCLFLTEIKYPFLCNLLRACIKYDMPNYAALLVNKGITKSILSYTNVKNERFLKNFKSNIEYQNLNESAKTKIETRFSWPYILFIEHLSFNPREFHREHQFQIVEETAGWKRACLKEQAKKNPKSARKALAMKNKIALQKQKYDAWVVAGANGTIPYYTLAVLLRFAVCERTNTVLHDDDDEIKEEGTDFTIAQCLITALQTILKFPQFATRILINTHNLKVMVNEMVYNEFKNTYSAIFKYKTEYQEHPQMYESFKELWQTYAKQIKSLLDVYHSAQHRLHREIVWIAFYQFHKDEVYEKKEEDVDNLFDYHKITHFHNIKEKYPNNDNISIQKQEDYYMDDVKQTFELFGYADDDQHRFYGNYYRHYVETDDPVDEDDDSAESGTHTEHSESGTPQEEEATSQHSEHSEHSDSFTSNSQHSDSSEAEDPDELPRHRRVDTDIDESNQLAKQFNFEQISKENVLEAKYDHSSDSDVDEQKEQVKRRRSQKKLMDEDSLNDFDDMNDENGINIVSDTKARGSNEFDSEDLKVINKASTESPSLSNISEDKVFDDDSGTNPFGQVLDDDMDQMNDENNEQQQSQQNNDNNDDDGNDNGDDEDINDDNHGQNGFDGGGNAAGDDDDGDDEKKKNEKYHSDDGDDDDMKKEEIEKEDEDEEMDDLGPLPSEKGKKHKREGSEVISEALANLYSHGVNLEDEELSLAKQFKSNKSNQSKASDDYYDDHDFKVNIGDTRQKIRRGDTKRRGLIFDKDDNDDNDESGDEYLDDTDVEDEDMDNNIYDNEEDNDRKSSQFKPNKQWAETLVNNPNILGMQSRDAMLQRKEEQQDLYKRHQIIRIKEDEEEELYSIFDGMKDADFVDDIMHGKELFFDKQEEDALVTDIVQKESDQMDVDDADENILFSDDRFEAHNVFSDEKFFQIKNNRWNQVGKTDPISSINKKVADNSYIMLKDMTEPLALSDLLGDFQKAGQIMLGRIDDMQASLIVENKLHSGVLKAHQMDSKNCYIEKEELLNTIEKLENELKLLRDKRDENKSETAALKTKQESYILKYNELKEVSTQKLRDQLRCFEIYKAQTTQLERRIHDVSYQTEIGFKRLRRLETFKKQQQLNISQLDIEIESMENEKNSLQSELENLESEQDAIDANEKAYVQRLKEQLRRLGKGMEQKEKSCNIFRRNVVEERLRIHTIDDSLKKLRTNANPTTTSDVELINATQHEALQAREKYAEKTQQHSFLTNIHQHEKNLIAAIEKVQALDDEIYAQKWNIIQKSWNLKKHLLTTAKYIQMKKWLLKRERNAKRHKKKLSKARFRKDSQRNLSIGAQQQFKKHSQDFSNF